MITLDLYKILKTSDGDLPLDINIDIKKGEFITIEGHSGAGKTTLLKLIAGLIESDKGKITVDKKEWLNTDKKIFLPPQKRNVGFVFQEYSLFPNMSVYENIAFGTEETHDKNQVNEIIDIMELEKLKDRYPLTLSGGQKQRAALARAIVRKPDILLLDEPLSALDIEMRLKLQDYILKVHRLLNLTTILVSHDISEIFKMSDRVIRLDKGKIIDKGIAHDVYQKNYISGKFRFTGDVLKIEKDDVVSIVSVLIGNNIIKVIAAGEEADDLQPGDKVMVVSKAFNPLIIKL
ncbi:MAG: ATP-binding cassette domain-containing protein [Ignavibacteriaceae bacterium]